MLMLLHETSFFGDVGRLEEHMVSQDQICKSQDGLELVFFLKGDCGIYVFVHREAPRCRLIIGAHHGWQVEVCL